jgi:hypothetical protein
MTAEPGTVRDASFIAGSGLCPYVRAGMIRLLSCLFVALALFASPLMMANGAGMAMSHAPADAGLGAAGHCAGDEAPADQQEAPTELSCASTCAAFLPHVPVAADEVPVALAVLKLPRDHSLPGIHPEGETPPPRITPEI